MPIYQGLTALFEVSPNHKAGYCIGIRLCFSATANQALEFLSQLQLFPEIRACALVTQAEYQQAPNWYAEHFIDLPLVVFSARDPALVDFDCFICPESNHWLYSELPTGIIRIGLPHGADIPLENTVEIYGGGYCFDYVLAPVKRLPLDEQRFVNCFHASLRNHHAEFICEVPFGIPKLDAMLRAVESHRNEPRCIIYHLSLLSLEPDWVSQLLLPTLQTLLEQFPSTRVVFRPHHLDRQHPLILEAKAFGGSFEHFYLSDSDSYISDYACGAVMICHREYQNHLFPMSTGKPMLRVSPEGMSATGYGHGLEVSWRDLASKVVDALNNSLHSSGNIAQVYNPGNAVGSFVARLPAILTHQPMADCCYYPLEAPLGNAGIPLTVLDIVLALIKGQIANLFFVALAERFPNWQLAQLMEVESFCRPTSLAAYYLPIAEQRLQGKVLSVAGDNSVFSTWWRYRHELFSVPLPDTVATMPTNVLTLFSLLRFKFVEPENGLVLYGSGVVAQRVIDALETQIGMINAIVDSHPGRWGEILAGHRIIAPEDALADASQIVICSNSSVKEIMTQLLHSHYLSDTVDILAVCPDEATAILLAGIIDEAESELMSLLQ
ncbi:hypothetical protein [Aeromonas enteropelogenes]|uniref:hypothetical protein n=1 Tax=Aeromonas enteropelogenes TaxID=29489 RepID=UPI003B9FBCE6